MSAFLSLIRDIIDLQPPKPTSRSYVQEDDAVDASDEEYSPVTHLFADDIKPDINHANSMRIALEEMSTCKGMFDKWADHLDRTAPSRMDDLERDLFAAVDELRDQATLALESSAMILASHETYAHEMASLLEHAAQHPRGEMYRPTEVLAIGEQILEHSSTLSGYSKAMQEQLSYVLNVVGQIKRRAEKKALWKKVLRWLVKAFNVLATVLAAGAFILPFVHPIGIIGTAALGTGSTLATAAAAVCKEMAGSEDADENFNKLLNFLQQKVPIEAERARRSLSTFQACHRVMQVDVRLKNGECVRMARGDAEHARNEWRQHHGALVQVNDAFRRAPR